ncbi:hypothetical protein JD292_04180 [Leucobacter sp. CSA2]|uniref:Uncharacterized protein n=1 Tax=Leucobacter edaphi TaxID=2796472 RepID=A0A934UXT3_9MICO|nr:hypothetical protein [Leucobacter edaphi]MBK0421277.1 hypothetical protein [Leucobacter edaphi]
MKNKLIITAAIGLALLTLGYVAGLIDSNFIVLTVPTQGLDLKRYILQFFATPIAVLGACMLGTSLVALIARENDVESTGVRPHTEE